MKIYKVSITEISRKFVVVEANNEEEAYDRVYDAWSNCEIMITPEDFEGVEVYVEKEMQSIEDYEVIK